jgi:hypothetical protein
MRYAAVYTDGVIGEVRTGDAPPSYAPPGYQWVDVSSSTLTDQQLLGSVWDGTQVVAKMVPPNFASTTLDMGQSMYEILTDPRTA